NIGEPFQIEMVTQDLWHRALRVPDVAAVEAHPDFTVRVRLLRDAVIKETLAFSRRVGEILKIANSDNPALHYRYYM
ncbi:MAG TPA: hypothetical protein VIK39_11365, partial [Candidatus Angelobacter sp.]